MLYSSCGVWDSAIFPMCDWPRASSTSFSWRFASLWILSMTILTRSRRKSSYGTSCSIPAFLLAMACRMSLSTSCCSLWAPTSSVLTNFFVALLLMYRATIPLTSDCGLISKSLMDLYFWSISLRSFFDIISAAGHVCTHFLTFSGSWPGVTLFLEASAFLSACVTLANNAALFCC